MKVKRGDLFVLWHVLEGLKMKVVNAKFSYFVAINRKRIKSEIEALNEAKEASEAFKAYDEKRALLAQNMADKDPSTKQPIIKNGQYSMEENKKEFDLKLESLKNQFAEVIEERNKQIDSFKELLDEEVEFKGHSISLSNLPDDIDPTTMEVFLTTNLIIEDKV